MTDEARRLAEQVDASAGRLETTARAVRDEFGVARLTAKARGRIVRELSDVGIVVRPSFGTAALDDVIVLERERAVAASDPHAAGDGEGEGATPLGAPAALPPSAIPHAGPASGRPTDAGPSSSPEATPPPPSPRRSRRAVGVGVGVAAVAILALVIAVSALTGGGDDGRTDDTELAAAALDRAEREIQDDEIVAARSDLGIVQERGDETQRELADELEAQIDDAERAASREAAAAEAAERRQSAQAYSAARRQAAAGRYGAASEGMDELRGFRDAGRLADAYATRHAQGFVNRARSQLAAGNLSRARTLLRSAERWASLPAIDATRDDVAEAAEARERAAAEAAAAQRAEEEAARRAAEEAQRQAEAAEESAPSGCDPNYSGTCVPVVPYDLNCGDIAGSVQVVGSDIHRFDGDGDGIGCE